MSMFPKIEAEVAALSDTMEAGFTAQPLFFPNADVGALQAARSAYRAAHHEQQACEAAYKLAVEKKQAALASLKACMKRELQRAEVDTVSDPERLELIGWAPRAAWNPKPPEQPRELRAERLENGVVGLKWRAPRWGDGGRIRSYAIERRQQQENGKKSDWAHVAVALKTRAELPDEPRGVLLEYRIVALNTSGASDASNVASVIV